MAEGGGVLVKANGAIGRFFFFKNLEQHTEKTLHSVGVYAVVIQQGQSVKSPKSQAVAVNNQKGFAHGIIPSLLTLYHTTHGAKIKAPLHYVEFGQKGTIQSHLSLI